MRDSIERVTVASWESLKKYIPYSSNDDFTPTFGHVVDQFRIQYNIYITVIPITRSTESDFKDDSIIFRYRIDIYKLSGNNVIIHWIGNDQAFYIAMRKAIIKAIDFIDD